MGKNTLQRYKAENTMQITYNTNQKS